MRLHELSIKNLSAGLLGAGLLGLLLTAPGTLQAQDSRDDAKPAQQEQPKDEAKPMQPNQAKPETRPEDAKPAKPVANEKNDKAEKQDDKATKPAPEDRAAQEHPAPNNARRASGQGQKIPDDKFRANFGRQHTFRVQTTVVEGQSRFQYSGYWFGLGNAWPVAWAYTDPCYVDDIDGEYVLIDLAHPGLQIPLLIVVM
jgi:hypothetical protein